MYKKGGLVLFLVLALIISFSLISAVEETNIDANIEVGAETGTETTADGGVETETDTNIISEIELEYPDAQLEVEAGTTPDSFLYFLDELFDGFSDDLKVREERIAEVREMIQQGKIEDAVKALEKYREIADKLEKEVDPDKRDEARRSAAAIRNTVNELESEIPEDLRERFVSDTLETEEGIITAAEISSKIKELCEQLSSLDPVEYSRVCLTEDDAPDWHKKLDKRLTEEQREEAIKFGKIMGECFETSGQQCRCEEIPFTEFAEMCAVAAPLVVKCDIQGDEAACEKMDNLEMPELPEHLQDVLDALENDMSESQLDVHMPRECREAGATNPRECMRIMIQTNAPEECRDALLEANIQNERQARELCEKIMFEQNAPEECIEQGLTNPRECGKLMFQMNAPQECIDAGLTGDSRGDEKKCREIMESQGRGERRGPQGGFGGNCQGIQNPEERLKCYDGAIGGTREYRNDHDERFRENQEKMRQCAQQCASQQKAWNFENGNCVCSEGNREDYSEYYRQGPNEGQYEEPQQEEFNSGEEFSGSGSGEQGSTTDTTQSGDTTSTETETTTSTETSSTDTSGSTSSDNTGSITGSVISGNGFLDYYFK